MKAFMPGRSGRRVGGEGPDMKSGLCVVLRGVTATGDMDDGEKGQSAVGELDDLIEDGEDGVGVLVLVLLSFRRDPRRDRLGRRGAG